MNFGSLTFNSAGAVAIAEDSNTQLSGASTADSLTLSSAAGITNASREPGGGEQRQLQRHVDHAGQPGGGRLNFGSLTFNSAGAVAIAEDSSTQLAA